MSVLLTALYKILPNNNETQTASTKIRQREHSKWVIWAQPPHESTFINVVSSEERSNNRAVWLLLLAITLKATTESLTCRLWVRASIHWHYWQKYPICMYLCKAKKWKVRGQTERKRLRRRRNKNKMFTSLFLPTFLVREESGEEKLMCF